MTKPVVLIAEELSPATIDALGPDFEVRHCDGANRDELLPALADVDAVLVRSATQIDAEALAAASRLKVVARAGVGLDNVDVKAATLAGVMVVNAPTSNITSRRRARRRAAAGHGPQHRAGQRRRSRAGSGSAASTPASSCSTRPSASSGLGRIGVLVAERLGRVRHEGRGLRPLRERGSRRRSSASAGLASRSCCGRATSSPSTCPRPPRPWA